MSIRNLTRAAIVASVCAVIGAGAGIAASAASPRQQRPSNPPTPPMAGPHGWGGHAWGGPVVHATQVVLDPSTKRYITQTIDDGTVSSVSGDQLAVKEGTGAVPYKSVTLTIAAGATVVRDGSTAKLSDLKSGDQVMVRQSSERTLVLALHPSASPGGRWPGRGGPGPMSHPGPGGPDWGY